MTSFIIKSHLNRPLPSLWKFDDSCPFCKIISGDLPAFRVYEDDKVIAILDILPLRRGHVLVIPKTHFSKISELPEEFAAATGVIVSRISNALTKALDNSGLNIVCNQEYAQAVRHVHYHIIPAPVFDQKKPPLTENLDQPPTLKQIHRLEFESREELDDDEAQVLVRDIKARL